MSDDVSLFTPEVIAKLQARLGQVHEVEQPYLRSINEDSIGRAARALGSTSPLRFDQAYASASQFGATVAPPALLYACAWGSWDLRKDQFFPGTSVLHAGDKWQYRTPLLAGDTIRATRRLTDCEPKVSRTGRTMVLETEEIQYFNQRDDNVATHLMSMIRTEAADQQSPVQPSEPSWTYTPEEIQRIDSRLLAEHDQGPTPRYWEDVLVGDAIAPIIRGPLAVADMFSWVQAFGAPHVRSGRYAVECRHTNPGMFATDPSRGYPQPRERLHWDAAYAIATTGRTAYDYGAQRGGYASQWATAWAGDDAWLASLDVQYRGIVYYGETVEIGGTVCEKWVEPTSNNHMVRATITATTNAGAEVMPGEATWALPSREAGPVRF